MNKRIWTFIFAVFLSAAPTITGAETVTVTAGRDNTLYESATGVLSNGAGAYLFAGRVGSAGATLRRRALLSFNLGSIPSAAVISSVSLTLNLSKTVSGPQAVTLHRLLSDWGEGSSDAGIQEGTGAAALTGDATWIHRFYNTSTWTSQGGDFSSTASASKTAGSITGVYTWESTPAMVADVQAWVNNPAGNFGWLLMGNESASLTAQRFDSRESALPANRPSLTVTYTTPIIPQSGDLNGDGFVTLLDAILALKIADRIDPGTEIINANYDISGDNRIGIEEVIYILQRISGSR